MKKEELKNKIRCGETSRVQFKQQFTTQKEIAAARLEISLFTAVLPPGLLFFQAVGDFPLIIRYTSGIPSGPRFVSRFHPWRRIPAPAGNSSGPVRTRG